jgi:hypothetical protein
MAPSPDDHKWEIRCGQHEARLNGVEDDVKALFVWREKYESAVQDRHIAIIERLKSVETKLVFFTAVAAAAGSLLPSLVSAMFK